MEQLERSEVPSVQMAEDILALFQEVNTLRRENWRLRKRADQLDNILDVF